MHVESTYSNSLDCIFRSNRAEKYGGAISAY
jgi:predicted outer membrane repeat protein